MFTQIISRNTKEEIFPNSCTYKPEITVMSKLYKDMTRKETFGPTSLVNAEIKKILHTILANQIQ